MFGGYALADAPFAGYSSGGASVSVTGQVITSSLGTAVMAFGIRLTGVGMTVYVGQITETHTANLSLTGLQMTTTLNNILPPGSVVVYPTGIGITTTLGTMPPGWTDVDDSQTSTWNNVI